jgi:hypothetical protein
VKTPPPHQFTILLRTKIPVPLLGRSFKVLLLALLYVCSVLNGCAGPTEHHWITEKSTDGRHELQVFYLEPFGFGGHDLIFYGDDKRLCRRTLNNDGANLGKHNIQIKWVGTDVVEIRLSGQEQKDDTFRLVLRND